jgi:hypothetical protein
MAKFKWWRHRVSQQNTCHIYNYARRMGKTTELCSRALDSHTKSCVILSPHSGMNRNAFNTMSNMLAHFSHEYYRINRTNLSIQVGDKTIDFMTYERAVSNYAMCGSVFPYEGRASMMERREYFIDNFEHLQANQPHSYHFLDYIAKAGYLSVITCTGGNPDRIFHDLFTKILARNKNLYYHKAYDEETINNYISTSMFSSRADAYAELRPGNLMVG